MGVVDDGRSGLAMLLSGSITDRPYCCAIGSGSVAFSVLMSGLKAEVDRNVFSVVDASTPKFVTYTTDFSSIEMSGISLTEFGTFSSGASISGTCWHREGFTSISFDGTNELQVQATMRIT